MSVDGLCEVCGAETPCERCRGEGRVLFGIDLGIDLGMGRSTTAVSMFRQVGRQLIHVVTGSPAEVMREWDRLAAEEGRPS